MGATDGAILRTFVYQGGVIRLAATIVPSLYAARLRPAEGFREQ